MIVVPLYSFLFIFLFFLALFAIFFLINVYHIFASASFTLASFTMTFFIVLISSLTVFATAQLLVDVDWQTPVTLFNSVWITNILTPGF